MVLKVKNRGELLKRVKNRLQQELGMEDLQGEGIEALRALEKQESLMDNKFGDTRDFYSSAHYKAGLVILRFWREYKKRIAERLEEESKHPPKAPPMLEISEFVDRDSDSEQRATSSNQARESVEEEEKKEKIGLNLHTISEKVEESPTHRRKELSSRRQSTNSRKSKPDIFEVVREAKQRLLDEQSAKQHDDAQAEPKK